MKRKVIQLAGRTLVVSLPNKWVKEYGVKKGDEVEVEENSSELRLRTKTDKTFGKAEVKINDKHPFLRRLVDNPYRQGYDEVTFYYDNPDTFEHIQKEVGNLMGFEIIKQGRNYCIMKNLAVGIDEQFESILNRLMMITFNMLEEVTTALEKEEFNELRKIEKMENTINKFSHFCKRMLNTKGYKEQIKITQLYRTVCLFEEIGDNLRDICKNSKHKKTDIATIKALQETHIHLKEYYKLFNKYKPEQVLRFGKISKKIESACIDNINKKKDQLINHYTLSILQNIKHLTEDLG